ncbi:MAG: hypothetical protein SVW77_03580 [Candidatus Nanohaloarchaea archaeon]|nr:hypothetical protein [Candidatus Nanohaloarchaea archaeon]
MPRHGITPVVAMVLLLLMTVAAAGGGYLFITSVTSQQREEATRSLATRISVKDVQCSGSTVEAALQNAGDTQVGASRVDALLYQGDNLVGSTQADLSSKGFTSPSGFGRASFTFSGTTLDPGFRYRLELEFVDSGQTVIGTCSPQHQIAGGGVTAVAQHHGRFQAPAAPGTVTVSDVGFAADLLVFQVTGTVESFNTTTQHSGEETGWGHGFARPTATGVEEVSLTSSSGSASMNGYGAGAADDKAIFQLITQDDGLGKAGFVNGSVTAITDDGFTVDFSAVEQQQYITFTAYNFSEGVRTDVGSFLNPTTATPKSIAAPGFRPNYLRIVTTPGQVNAMDSVTVSDPDSHGWTHGWAVRHSTGGIEQLTMAVTGYGNNRDSHVWASDDSEIVHTLFKQDSGGINGRITASVSSFDSSGFTLDYTTSNPNAQNGNRFVHIYAAVNSSAEPDIGYDLSPLSTGTQTVSTSVSLDTVSLAASNTIGGIDVERFSGNNNANNHFSWMFGGGNASRSSQVAMGYSTHSDSTNGHHSGSSTISGFYQVFSDRDGNLLGTDVAHIESTGSNQFTLDWTSITTSSTSNVRHDTELFVYSGFSGS